MNKYVFAALGALLLVPAAFVSAETIMRTGSSVTVGDDQSVQGDFYSWGNTVSVSGVVEGDVVAAGGTVTVNGSIAQDLLAAAGSVSIDGVIEDDVRVVGGDVMIGGEIKGSVVVVGGRIQILPTAHIYGDVVVYGERVVIDGDIDGNVLGTVNTLQVNSTVGQNITITTSVLTLTDRANIAGNIAYTSPTELSRAPNTVISGSITRTEVAEHRSLLETYRTTAMWMLTVLFGTLTWYLVARRYIFSFSTNVKESPWWRPMLLGSAVLISGPFIVGVLFASVLGAVVGATILFAYVAMLCVAVPLIPVVLAVETARIAKKEIDKAFLVWIFGSAAVLLCILPLTIFAAFLVLALYLVAVGTIVTMVWGVLQDTRTTTSG